MFQKIYLWLKFTIMTRLVTHSSPGPIWRLIFKLPLLLDRLGPSWMLGGRILILTTDHNWTRHRQNPPHPAGIRP